MFEYLLVKLTSHNIDDMLKEYGNDGWELVNFTKAKNGYGDEQYELIFKRKKDGK